jgi:hypothetical protein
MVGGRSQQALVSQLAEETDSKPVQCEFESHRGHPNCRSIRAGRWAIFVFAGSPHHPRAHNLPTVSDNLSATTRTRRKPKSNVAGDGSQTEARQHARGSIPLDPVPSFDFPHRNRAPVPDPAIDTGLRRVKRSAAPASPRHMPGRCTYTTPNSPTNQAAHCHGHLGSRSVVRQPSRVRRGLDHRRSCSGSRHAAIRPPRRCTPDLRQKPQHSLDDVQPQKVTPSRSAVMMRLTSARWSIGMGPAGMLTAPSLKMTLMGSAG